MTSVFEGLPIALLEAMSSGCAVISTKAGGIREVIRDKVDGLLCDVDEPEKLVELACDLIRNKQKRSEMALQGRKRIISVFSMENMVLKLENLYKELIYSQLKMEHRQITHRDPKIILYLTLSKLKQ